MLLHRHLRLLASLVLELMPEEKACDEADEKGKN